VPIFYTLAIVPAEYVSVYQFNPIAALILALRRILIDAASPDTGLLMKFAFSSTVAFAAGLTIYSKLKSRFFDYL